MSQAFITYIPNAFPLELCDAIIDYFHKSADLHVKTDYGEGENTNTIMMFMDRTPSFMYAKHDDLHSQCTALNESIKAILLDVLSRNISIFGSWFSSPAFEDYCFTGFQIRQMIGETRDHIDDVDPLLVHNFDGSVSCSYRIATIIVTLNDTNDRIVFPVQQNEFKLTKGGILCFPPYWMYPHKSVHSNSNSNPPRISLQTWLVRKTKVTKAHLSHFV